MYDGMSKFEEVLYGNEKIGDPILARFDHRMGLLHTDDNKSLERGNLFIIDDEEQEFDIYIHQGYDGLNHFAEEHYIETGLIHNGKMLLLRCPITEISRSPYAHFASHPSKMFEKQYFEMLNEKQYGKFVDLSDVHSLDRGVEIPGLGYFRIDHTFTDEEGNVLYYMISGSGDPSKNVFMEIESKTGEDEPFFFNSGIAVFNRVIRDTGALSRHTKQRKTSNR